MEVRVRDTSGQPPKHSGFSGVFVFTSILTYLFFFAILEQYLNLMKILIATTNQGKFTEFTSHFHDLKFDFVSLTDVGLDSIDLEEPFPTTWENALHKARFFAEKSGLLTIAEDTGFYIDALDGAPGVHAKRLAPTAEERNQKVLQDLENVPEDERTSHFTTHACVFNPLRKSFSIFEGSVHGRVTASMEKSSREGMGYDSIFYYPPLQKTFAELTVEEKNKVSHRGYTIRQLKIFLDNQYNFKQLISPVAMIVKDRKMLATKRIDLGFPDFHDKWEFPGGGIENGESVEECLKREVKEEVGYAIKVEELIPIFYTSTMPGKDWGGYQIFLLFYICTITGGEFKLAPKESSDHGWFTFEELIQLDFLPLNINCIQDNISILKKYID